MKIEPNNIKAHLLAAIGYAEQSKIQTNCSLGVKYADKSLVHAQNCMDIANQQKDMLSMNQIRHNVIKIKQIQFIQNKKQSLEQKRDLKKYFQNILITLNLPKEIEQEYNFILDENLYENDKIIPDFFKCKYSGKLMYRPIQLPNGDVYDHDNIEKEFGGKKRDTTREEQVGLADATDDRNLYQAIDQLRQEFPFAFYYNDNLDLNEVIFD